MKKLIKIGGILIAAGIIVLIIAWAKSGFGLSISSFKKIDPVNLQAAQTKDFDHFKSININTRTNVTIKTGNQFKVVSRTPKGVSIHSKLDGDQLKVTQSGQANKTKYFGAIVINGDWDDLNGNVTIYVPSEWKLDHIIQESENDSLTLEHLTINDGLKLHGDVDLKYIRAHYLNASAEAGDISVINSQFEKGQSTIDTASGDVEINKSSFAKLTKIENDSGDVDITNLKVTNGPTSISSDSGDVTVRSSQFNTLRLASSNGDIDFKNLDIRNNLSATNDNGDIEGKLAVGDRANIKTTNDNGDVDVKKSLNDIHSDKQYDFSNSNGDIDIE